MVRFLFDQNFDQRIIRGLLRRIPDLDYATTEELGLKSLPDDRLLAEAVALDRVIITHDARTFPDFAYERLQLGAAMKGLVVVPTSLAIAKAIDELAVVVMCRFDNEWENSVIRLPI